MVERLRLAARGFARVLIEERNSDNPNPIRIAICEARQASTFRRWRKLKAWLREHPFYAKVEYRAALEAFDIPRGRRNLLLRIEALHLRVVREFAAKAIEGAAALKALNCQIVEGSPKPPKKARSKKTRQARRSGTS